MAMGVLLGEPFGRLKNHLVHGLIARINVSLVHCGAPGWGRANGPSQGWGTWGRLRLLGSGRWVAIHSRTLQPRSGHEDWGLAVDSRVAHHHSFGLFRRTEMSTQWFCDYERTCFYPLVKISLILMVAFFSGSKIWLQIKVLLERRCN